MRPNARLIHWAAIRAQPIVPLVWDVEPWFARGDRMVLFGDFGALKSWTLLEMALHLAAGRDWLGFTIPAPRRVLYVDEEQPERVLRRRLKRLAAGAAEPFPDALPLAAYSRAGVRLTPGSLAQLLTALARESFAPEVVMVETLARTLEGDESHNAHVSAMWQHIERLTSAGMSVILSHHMAKPPADNQRALRYRARGATDILAGCDVVVAVEGTLENRARMRFIKNREAALAAPWTVTLVDLPPGGHDGPLRLERVTGRGRGTSGP